MATDEIERLMLALEGLKTDVEWLKKGMFAQFTVLGMVLAGLALAVLKLHM